MIADYADKLNTYEEFKDYADMVQQFIKKQKEENLPEGRYDLKNGIFALVQKYTTKPLEGAQMESHKKYCDLQYIVEEFTEGFRLFICRKIKCRSCAVSLLRMTMVSGMKTIQTVLRCPSGKRTGTTSATACRQRWKLFQKKREKAEKLW